MKVEQQFIDKAIAAALERARIGPSATFAATLVRWLPDAGQGRVWVDLDLLTDSELLLLQKWQP